MISSQKLNIISFVKAEFMKELLHWITLDCTSVAHAVASDWRRPPSTGNYVFTFKVYYH